MRQMQVPVAVEIAAVQRTTIRDVGLFSGTLFTKSQFVIAPKISGHLEKLTVNIGDWVERGQLIAVLDDKEHSQQVAQANLEEASSSLEIAKRGLDRAQTLHRKGIASDSRTRYRPGRLQGPGRKIQGYRCPGCSYERRP